MSPRQQRLAEEEAERARLRAEYDAKQREESRLYWEKWHKEQAEREAREKQDAANMAEARRSQEANGNDRGWLDSDGDILTDDSIADPEESPAHIVTLGPLHKIATAVAHLTHAARTDGAHHKQHDVCEALKVLLSAEDYAALGIVDEGVPS